MKPEVAAGIQNYVGYASGKPLGIKNWWSGTVLADGRIPSRRNVSGSTPVQLRRDPARKSDRVLQPRRPDHGSRPLRQRLVAGCWLLVAGHRLSVVGCRWLAVGGSDGLMKQSYREAWWFGSARST